MRRVASFGASLILASLSITVAVAAPERWVFDIVDAQTSAAVGSATVVGKLDARVSPTLAQYSLQFTLSKMPVADYTLWFWANALPRKVDFSSAADGDSQLRVDPILALLSTPLSSPTIKIYSGGLLKYQGILKRGNGGPGPTDGMGAISGDCGLITSGVISASSPFQFRSAIDFGADPYDASDIGRLSPGAQAILAEDTSGGSAAVSRAFAFEMLRRCEGAQLLKTAGEIEYVDAGGKKTSFSIDIAGRKVGVMSTRAYKPFGQPYTVAEAKTLLERYLGDVNQSTLNVTASDRWTKQVLHVFADFDESAISLESAYLAIDASLKANTILLITVSNGSDLFLYQ